MSTKYYCIVDTVDVIDNMIDESLEKKETLRYSLDGSKVILKFTTKFPNTMAGYTKYTHDEILEILKGIEWVDPEVLAKIKFKLRHPFSKFA
jgi:hypothetical protein